jgi:hypothetical protein
VSSWPVTKARRHETHINLLQVAVQKVAIVCRNNAALTLQTNKHVGAFTLSEDFQGLRLTPFGIRATIMVILVIVAVVTKLYLRPTQCLARLADWI